MVDRVRQFQARAPADFAIGIEELETGRYQTYDDGASAVINHFQSFCAE